jgi:hypothetical protein
MGKAVKRNRTRPLLHRARVVVDARRIATLRARGLGWKKIARQLGCGVSSVLRIAQEASQHGSIIRPEKRRGQLPPFQHPQPRIRRFGKQLFLQWTVPALPEELARYVDWRGMCMELLQRRPTQKKTP